MKDNPRYVRFLISKYIDSKFGSGMGKGRIYSFIGSFEDTDRVIYATILDDLARMRDIQLNESKRSLIEFLKLVPDGLVRLDPKKDYVYIKGKGRVPKELPRGHSHKLFTVLEDGKPEHYYIDRVMADTFEYKPYEATQAARIWAGMMQPIRDIMVSKDPIWMIANIPRDFFETLKKQDSMKLRDALPLANYYRKAFKEVWADVMKHLRSQDIQTMANEKMILQNRAYDPGRRGRELAWGLLGSSRA